MKKFLKNVIITSTIALSSFCAFNINNNQAQASTKSYSRVKSVAINQLGKKYVWGAVGPNTFDCSGLTSYTYKNSIHKTIPRTAQAQYNADKKVSYSHIKRGDLVFFGMTNYTISHVGMYIGNGKMIDAQLRGVITENVKAPWWHYVGAARVSNLKY